MLSTQQAGRERDRYLKNDYGSMVELTSDEAESRNWKGIGIALAVILTVFGVVALTAYLFTEEQKEVIVSKILQSDVFEEKWKPTKVFWNRNHLIYQNRRGNVVIMESQNSQPNVLIPNRVMADNKIQDFQISKDENYALLAYDQESIFSYSLNSSYYIYDIKRTAILPFMHDEIESKFQFVTFGAKSHDIVYYVDGDLFYKENVRGNAENLTSGGEHGIYQNGLADWLYEEEIFKSDVALWWSKNGRYLAYASFDDRKVDDGFITLYDAQDEAPTYPKIETYKCPKAGQRSPVVEVHLYDTEQKEKITFSAPTFHGQNLEILRLVEWMSDEQVLITWSNSAMTESVTKLCEIKMRSCENVIETKENNDQSITRLTDLDHQTLMSDSPGVLFKILPSDQGGKQWKHLAMMNVSEKPATVKFLTEGKWEVTKILHHDVERGIVYFISNEEHPGSRHVYQVYMNGRRYCITCNVSTSDGTSVYSTFNFKIDDSFSYGSRNQCLYYDASFGSNSCWFQVTCLGPSLPFTGMISMNFTSRKDHTNGNMDFLSFELLVPPTAQINQSRLPERRMVRFEKDNVEILFEMLLPDPVHLGRRPIIFVMGDFAVPKADFRFKLDLASYVVVNSGAVGIYIDRTDSSFWNDISLQTESKPGKSESDDMISVLKYIKSKQHLFENVDVSNAGVIGMSGYGGYSSILALEQETIVCGFAFNPVNDWRLYNSIGAAIIPGSSDEENVLYNINSRKNPFDKFKDFRLRIFHEMQNRKEVVQHSMLLDEATLMSDLPSDSVEITFLPQFDRHSKPQEWQQIKANLYRSATSFMRECLYNVDITRRMKLKLLDSVIGKPS